MAQDAYFLILLSGSEGFVQLNIIGDIAVQRLGRQSTTVILVQQNKRQGVIGDYPLQTVSFNLTRDILARRGIASLLCSF